ncbi:hypothetical protein DL769_001697 [Monosporascus sp. CRB-8-3]|nr:hypothetical protein DL769_001697 [Monosporascus sp. CRB-8-3]
MDSRRDPPFKHGAQDPPMFENHDGEDDQKLCNDPTVLNPESGASAAIVGGYAFPHLSDENTLDPKLLHFQDKPIDNSQDRSNETSNFGMETAMRPNTIPGEYVGPVRDRVVTILSRSRHTCGHPSPRSDLTSVLKVLLLAHGYGNISSAWSPAEDNDKDGDGRSQRKNASLTKTSQGRCRNSQAGGWDVWKGFVCD